MAECLRDFTVYATCRQILNYCLIKNIVKSGDKKLSFVLFIHSNHKLIHRVHTSWHYLTIIFRRKRQKKKKKHNILNINCLCHFNILYTHTHSIWYDHITSVSGNLNIFSFRFCRRDMIIVNWKNKFTYQIDQAT